ncbi:MAG: hypothetical protein KA761_14195, partial [Gemmatimonadaceae bacterium]|nr:hypothetical protein [Gemmatimonadaceae bacterium]
AASVADDAALAAMYDAAVAPDAFTAADAFTARLDAFTAADAFARPVDAFTPPVDAFTPRDAFAAADAPAAPTYCDVVYAIGGGTCMTPTRTGRFHNIKTGLGAMNTEYPVGTNCGAPRRGTMGGTAVATPFTPEAFPRGYIRLRFPERGGVPVAGAVEMIEYFLPIEFTVSATGGTMVNTNVDHSAGLLRYATTGCGMGTTGCITGASDTVAPVLDRQCRAVASGTLAGTTVMWGGCGVATPAPCLGTGCTPTMAQLRWTSAMSQDGAMGAGCLTNMNTWGGVHCTAGLCGFVPGTGAPTNSTWDQRLPDLTFSSTSYGAMGTTVTLTEMTIPDDPNDVYSGTQVITATAVHTECGVVTALSCNEQ